MTSVKVVRSNDFVNRIQISNHANAADYGEDVVCAGISAVIFGGLNALVMSGLDQTRVEIKDAFVNVDLTQNEKLQIIAQTIIIQLETIQESYPDYIDIQNN
ncbi:ribosomal-processing cysteine protease Prp [Mycoplasma sp. P36-A1]|uniref:ribosomal-processing cysteine protease Prp n=1 Tax=Mycoplasma sp. P36-A1 TaxID=3252900 RepID=UPI003C2BE7C3